MRVQPIIINDIWKIGWFSIELAFITFMQFYSVFTLLYLYIFYCIPHHNNDYLRHFHTEIFDINLWVTQCLCIRLFIYLQFFSILSSLPSFSISISLSLSLCISISRSLSHSLSLSSSLSVSFTLSIKISSNLLLFSHIFFFLRAFPWWIADG